MRVIDYFGLPTIIDFDGIKIKFRIYNYIFQQHIMFVNITWVAIKKTHCHRDNLMTGVTTMRVVIFLLENG